MSYDRRREGDGGLMAHYMNRRSMQGNRTWRGIRALASGCACLALLLTAEGCWTRSHRLDQPTPIRCQDTVWIWSGGKGVRWREVIMRHDSVTGIPYHAPRDCDDCRVGIPFSEVDSIVDVRPGVTRYLVGLAGSAALIYVIVVVPKSH